MVAEKSDRRALLKNRVRLKKRHGEYCWLEQGAGKISSPNGVRTRVFGVRGRYPRPLDDGTVEKKWLGD